MPPKKKLKASDNLCEEKKTSSSATKEDYKHDWREKCKNVRDIYKYALEKSFRTDVTFIVGEEQATFNAHRIILALGSPVFEAMFFGGLAEKGESVTIPDVDPKGFDNLLRFLYSADVIFQNDVVAFKTYFAADKYCITRLKEQCETYLCKCELKPSNVWIFLESSLFLNSQSIKNSCLTFLKGSTKAALEDNSFLDVTPKTLETLLCLDSMDVPEIKLLLNVIRWAEHKSNLETNTDSFQNILMPLLKFVRFGALSAPEFITFLEMPKVKDVVKTSDALAILKFIVKPLTCALPDWCCQKFWRNRTFDESECKRDPNSHPCDKKTKKEKIRKMHRDFHLSSSSSDTSSSSSSESSSSSSDSVSSSSSLSFFWSESD